MSNNKKKSKLRKLIWLIYVKMKIQYTENAEFTFFSKVKGTQMKTDHMTDGNKHLNELPKGEIVQAKSSDHKIVNLDTDN